MATVTFDSTVCSGFPVCVEAEVFRGDRSVGDPYWVVEDIVLTNAKGQPVPFIEAKMAQLDWDTLIEEAIDAL